MSGALAIDELGRREVIGPVVFTGAVVTMMEEALPPIPPMRGEPGSWLYFRSGDRFPIERFKVGNGGTTDETVGFMAMEDAHRVGLFEQIGPLESLPHSDSIPNSRARSAIWPVYTGVLCRACRRGPVVCGPPSRRPSNCIWKRRRTNKPLTSRGLKHLVL